MKAELIKNLKMMKTELSKPYFKTTIILLVVSLFMFTSCNDDDNDVTITTQELLDLAIDNVDELKLAEDLQIIDDSLAVWEFTDLISIEPHGVRYKVEVLGTGVMPILESQVQFKYTAKFLSTGIEFDANESFDSYLSSLIIGFQTTLPVLPVGTIATLYIPSGYAYGSTDVFDSFGNLTVPANSNLIFDIELINAY